MCSLFLSPTTETPKEKLFIPGFMPIRFGMSKDEVLYLVDEITEESENSIKTESSIEGNVFEVEFVFEKNYLDIINIELKKHLETFEESIVLFFETEKIFFPLYVRKIYNSTDIQICYRKNYNPEKTLTEIFKNGEFFVFGWLQNKELRTKIRLSLTGFEGVIEFGIKVESLNKKESQ